MHEVNFPLPIQTILCNFQPVERYFLLATNILQLLQEGWCKMLHLSTHVSVRDREVILSFTVLGMHLSCDSLNSALYNSAGYDFF